MVSITVSLCTHNPRRDYLDRVLNALKLQSLSVHQWEFILVDNASKVMLEDEIDISWHPNGKHVREETLGLTAARLRTIQEAKGDTIIFVDDDNILAKDYLEQATGVLTKYPKLGAFGGKSIPEFESEPEDWVRDLSVCLAFRDLGDTEQIFQFSVGSPKQYPEFAPIGAGLVLNRQAAEIYAKQVSDNPVRLTLGRTGKQLISGEDNDINLTILEAGWQVAYTPHLHLTHLISSNRLTKDYLARLNQASSKSWVQVLDAHGIRPWPRVSAWSVLLRKIKAFWVHQAWRSPAHYVRWRGACGLFEGLATLSE